MTKKLTGDYFLLSANELKSGKVVFYSLDGWSIYSKRALKIKREDLEKYKEIFTEDERKCKIVSPLFVELDELGKIKKLRDKIRNNGVTIKID